MTPGEIHELPEGYLTKTGGGIVPLCCHMIKVVGKWANDCNAVATHGHYWPSEHWDYDDYRCTEHKDTFGVGLAHMPLPWQIMGNLL